MTRRFAIAMVILAACATESVERDNTQLAKGGGGGSDGAGGPGGGGCAAILEEDCDPAGKSYTPAQIAACKEARQKSFDLCVIVEKCDAIRLVDEKKCGPKPAADSPELAVFIACLDGVYAAFQKCIGDNGGGGGGGTGGPGK